MFLLNADHANHTTQAELELLVDAAHRICRLRGQRLEDATSTRRAELAGFTVLSRIESPGRPRRGHPKPDGTPDPDHYLIQPTLEIQTEEAVAEFRWHLNSDVEVDSFKPGSWVTKLIEAADALKTVDAPASRPN